MSNTQFILDSLGLNTIDIHIVDVDHPQPIIVRNEVTAKRMEDDFLRALSCEHELNMLIAQQELDMADEQDLLDESMGLLTDWRAMYAVC